MIESAVLDVAGGPPATVDPSGLEPRAESGGLSALSALRLERFLLGPTRATGIFEDRFGAVRRRMSIALNGWMDGASLLLDEDFTYDDGLKERRLWRITPEGDTGYVASAEGVHGLVRGGQTADGVRWAYDFDLAMGAKTWRVRFDERFTMLGPDLMVNRAVVRKCGITLGRTTILFQRG